MRARSQPEGQRVLDGGEVALGHEELPLLDQGAGLEPDLAAQRISVGSSANQGQTDPVVLRSPFVS